jgi:hypothetical protein
MFENCEFLFDKITIKYLADFEFLRKSEWEEEMVPHKFSVVARIWLY